MERCQICNKYTGLPKPIGLGEKCDFTIITVKGRTTRHRVVTGKLNRTWAGAVTASCIEVHSTALT